MDEALKRFSTAGSFAALLCRLRWLGVAGQAATIHVVTGPMNVALDREALWSGVVALAIFNAFVTLRLRSRRPIAPWELFAHLAGDVAVLTWQVGWSGGIENPFSSLFLLPIALSTLSLPTRWVWATAAFALLGFGVAVVWGIPLPHVHGLMGDAFSLHKVGMLVNFLVSAAVMLVFLLAMARLWRARERELATLRERFTRNEGIVALATHAASVAHELNTPLATLTLMVDDLVSDGAVAREDADNLRTLLAQCRDRVRALALPAQQSAQDSLVDLESIIDRWLLVRPTVELHRESDADVRRLVDHGVGHLLQALLNNAADASAQSGSTRVDLRLAFDRSEMRGEIRDYGPGFSSTSAPLPGTLYRTSKPEGLGIGLALSHATVERLGGELSMRPAEQGPGVVVSFRLPASVAP